MPQRYYFVAAAIALLLGPAFAHDHVHDHGPAPVHYVSNKGQWPAQVLYRSAVQGAVAFLERDGITWVKYEDAIYHRMHDAAELSLEEQLAMTWKGHPWRMDLVDALPSAVVEPLHRQQAYHNYFLGNDPTQWAGGVPLFGEVL